MHLPDTYVGFQLINTLGWQAIHNISSPAASSCKGISGRRLAGTSGTGIRIPQSASVDPAVPGASKTPNLTSVTETRCHTGPH